MRYLGWVVSTGQVERTFVTARKELLRRAIAGPPAMFNVLKLAEPMPSDDARVDRVISRAREVWRERFGLSRSGGKHGGTALGGVFQGGARSTATADTQCSLMVACQAP